MEIERNIPIPITTWPIPRGEMSLALDEMEIGESIWRPFRKRLASNAHMMASRIGIKVVTRTVMKDGVKGVRIWRVRKVAQETANAGEISLVTGE